MINIDGVDKRLKQRPPFQMIEKIEEIVSGESAVGYKAVSVNEPYFMGHFPDSPIMPGVLEIESCAQLCSVVLDEQPKEDEVYVLLKVDQFKLLKPVIPGDLMRVEVKKEMAAGVLFRFSATVTVDGDVKAKGVLTFTTMKKSDIYNR